MLFDRLHISLTAVLPEILLTVLALSLLVADFFLRRRDKTILGYAGVAGLLILLPVVATTVEPAPSFGGTVAADRLSAFFNTLFVIAGILTLTISMDYFKKRGRQQGEYYPLVLFAILGMMVLASANDFISFYVGLELMALSFYVLVALGRNPARSIEGALKYFVLGALSSGILLYGISFAYGFGGTTNLTALARQAMHSPVPNPFLLLALVLIASGFAFKLALFPFHVWAPDAYEAAPPPIAALLSVGSKAAAAAVFLRIFTVALPAFQPQWSQLLWLLSAGTMIFGSVVAISQKNIIRMMAYSSIAHAGIIIIGLLVATRAGLAAMLYYLLVYTFMNMGVFTVVTLAVQDHPRGEYISDYQGLGARHPLVAFCLALFLFALAGVPPTGGFTAKFFIFAAAIDAGYYWLAAIGVATTAMALFFYAKVIYYMFMQAPAPATVNPHMSAAGKGALFIAVLGTLIPGIVPAPFMEWAVAAIRPLLM
jgi:NADH-quinone oxidoreductase subunit N